RMSYTYLTAPFLVLRAVALFILLDVSLFFFFFFKQKTEYEFGLGIPAEPLFRSISSLFLRSASISGLRRDAVQPDIEAERKKRDEIEAGKSYCSRRFGGATCDDKSAQIYARFDKNDWRIQPRSEERRVGKECR